MFPEDRKYTADHHWILLRDQEATVGLTPVALANLGEILAVELPEEEEILLRGKSYGVIEGEQGLWQILCPLTGLVVAVNEGLKDLPERLKLDPYDTGWLFRLELLQPEQVEELLTAKKYAQLLPRLIRE